MTINPSSSESERPPDHSSIFKSPLRSSSTSKHKLLRRKPRDFAVQRVGQSLISKKEKPSHGQKRQRVLKPSDVAVGRKAGDLALAGTSIPIKQSKKSHEKDAVSLLYCDEELDLDLSDKTSETGLERGSVLSTAATGLSCYEELDCGKVESPTIFQLLPIFPKSQFPDRLIVNYLDQVSSIHEREWKWLERQKVPDFLLTTVQVIFKALKTSESPQMRHMAFVNGLLNGIRICGEEDNLSEVKTLFYNVIHTMYTRINALKVHREALAFYTPEHAKPNPFDNQLLLSSIPSKKHLPPIIAELANLWHVAYQTSGDLNVCLTPNLPNQLFQISIMGKEEPITFFRMQSPENPINEIDPLYLRFLEHHKSSTTSHLSLVSLSPGVFDTESEIARKRFTLQWEFPHSLNAFRCEPDSDFLCQEERYSDTEKVSVFINTLFNHLTKESDSFEIIPEVRDSTYFKKQVKDIIGFVKNLFFEEKKFLTPEEKQDFSLMCIILLLENFCDDMGPSTVDTACRSHIDRGMMISTLFYIYLMIKSGNENNPQFIDYLKPLTLAPALIVAQRPPHSDKMRRLLSLASRMLQPDAIKKLRKHKTFFSGCGLRIPD